MYGVTNFIGKSNLKNGYISQNIGERVSQSDEG